MIWRALTRLVLPRGWWPRYRPIEVEYRHQVHADGGISRVASVPRRYTLVAEHEWRSRRLAEPIRAPFVWRDPHTYSDPAAICNTDLARRIAAEEKARLGAFNVHNGGGGEAF